MNEIAFLKERIRYVSFVFHAITAGAVAYLSTGIFLSVLYYPHLWITLALAVAAKRTLKNELDRFNVCDRIPEYSWSNL